MPGLLGSGKMVKTHWLANGEDNLKFLFGKMTIMTPGLMISPASPTLFLITFSIYLTILSTLLSPPAFSPLKRLFQSLLGVSMLLLSPWKKLKGVIFASSKNASPGSGGFTFQSFAHS